VSRRGGFTLIEVMVASPLPDVSSRRTDFTGVWRRARAAAAARESLDRTVNARAWLKATFLSLDHSV